MASPTPMANPHVIPLPFWTAGDPIVVDGGPGIVIEAFTHEDGGHVLGVRMAVLEVVDHLASGRGTYTVELAFNDRRGGATTGRW